MKVVTNGFLEVNELQKLAFLRLLFSNKKGPKSVAQEICIFVLILECSCLDKLQICLSAGVSSKVATNGSLRGKQTSKSIILGAIFLYQKRRSATEVIHVFEMVLEGPYLPQLYIFRK